MSRGRSLLGGACGALGVALVGLWAARSPPPLPGPAAVDVLILGGWEQANPPLDRLAREKHLVLRSVRQTELEKPDSTPDLDRARVVLVLNGPSEQQAAFQERLRRAHEGGRHLVALDGRPWQQSLVASGVIERDDQLARYWRFSGTQNLSHLLDHVAARYLGRGGEAAPPEPSPTTGFYHPDAPEIIGPIADYRRWYASHLALPEDAPRVAYIVHGSFLLLRETADTDAVIRALERRGMRVFTIFADREQSMREAIAAIGPDLLLTQRHTGLGRPADGSTPIPESVGKPYLKPIGALQTTVEEWRDRPEGLRPGDLAGQVIAQELEGTIEPLVISAQRTAGEYRVQVPLPERVERFADRAASWVALQRTPEAEKRLSIVYYNVDLGGGSLAQGSASGMFLDGPESLQRVLGALAGRGYGVEVPASRAELIARMSRSGRNYGPWAQAEIDALARDPDAVLVRVADYLAWFERDLTEGQRRMVIAAHGEPPGKLMVTGIHGEAEFVLPRVRVGPKVSLFPQPEKGARQDSRLVHDQRSPPSHQYLAFYLWQRNVQRPHAIIHFGTHGTLELLPRRAAGLGPDDFADALLGATPNLNPWILDNVAEATLARRRAYAVLIGHLVPAIESTVMSRPMTELHEEVERAISLEEGPVREAYRTRVLARARAQAFAGDLTRAPALDDEALRELDLRLHTVAEEQAPRSLHVLGEPPPAGRRPGYVTAILGREFWDSAGGRPRAEELARCVLAGGASCLRGLPAGRAAAIGPMIERARRVDADLGRAPDEIGHLLDALDGKYVPPGPGNDPVRNPASLPSGRNLYALDPEQVPSAPAMEVGRALAEQTVEAFRKKHGQGPRKIAINLNGFETMRDTGVTEAEALALLGVDPVRDERGLVTAVSLVPRERLGRPRVDVVMAISGAYRDNFGSRIKLLDRAVQLAREAREPDNAIAEDTRAAEQELTKRGVPAAQAARLAGVRIYGQAPGQYGTQTLYLIPRSGAWEQRSEVAAVYRENMRFAYGGGAWGEPSDEGFTAAMAGAEAVSHVWSSNMMSPLTNHHVYEYLGGLSMAVEEASGKAPEALIADARDPSRPRTRELSEVVGTEAAVRLLNDRWIEDMKKQGYAGAGHVNAYVENLFGWSSTVPGSVEPRLFARIEEVYLRDPDHKGTRRWLEEAGPDALAGVTATLLEAARRGYWQPTAAVSERLVADYMEQVVKHGEPTGMMAGGNEKLRAHVEGVVARGGVSRTLVEAYQARVKADRATESGASARRDAAVAARQDAPARKVKGVAMKPVPAPAPPPPWAIWAAAGSAFVIISSGATAGTISLRARRRGVPS